MSKVKNRASGFIKQIIGVITSIAKAKSALALTKTKMSAIKSRLIILSLLRNKKVLLTTISHKLHKLHAMVVSTHHDHHSNHGDDDCAEEDESKAIVVYDNSMNAMQNIISSVDKQYYNVDTEYDYDDDKYPDLTHSLFEDDDDDEIIKGGSVIDLVRCSKEEDGEEFVLEDEIDQVADLFIKRFHRQIRMQKQLSFKLYQDMLERSV